MCGDVKKFILFVLCDLTKQCQRSMTYVIFTDVDVDDTVDTASWSCLDNS